MKCKKCGNELEKNSNVCKNCGTKTLKKLSKKQIIIIVIVGLIFTFSGTIFDLILDNLIITDVDYEFLEKDLNTVAESYEYTNIIDQEEKGKYQVTIDYTKNNVIMVSDLKKHLKREGAFAYNITKTDQKLLKKCDGYVTISKNTKVEGISSYKTYITCGKDYTTKGFDNGIKKTVLNVNKKEIIDEITSDSTNDYYILSNVDKKLELKNKLTTSTYNIGDKIDDSTIIGIYNCSSDDCDIADEKDNKHDTILISDNDKIVVYNFITTEKINTKLKNNNSNFINYETVFKNGKVIGIVVNSISVDDKTTYYSIKAGKNTIDLGKNKYGNRNTLKSYESFANYGCIVKDNYVTSYSKKSNSNNVVSTEMDIYSLIDIETGKEIGNSQITDGSYTEINNVPVISTKDGYSLIGKSLKPVFKNKYIYFYNASNKVYAYSFNKYGVYDKNSNNVSENEKNVVSYYEKYFLTKENNIVSVYNADTNSVIKSISFKSPEDLQLQTVYLVNKNNINIEGMNFNGTYLFLMKAYMKCDAYKINESNNSVDLVYSNISYCGY